MKTSNLRASGNLCLALLSLAGVAALAQARPKPAPQEPQYQMSPELMRRYGLVPPENAVPLPAPGAPAMDPAVRARYGLGPAIPGQPAEPALPRHSDEPVFDLDFPGGTARDLIKSIEEELPDSHVNVVVPDEYAQVRLPPLRMKSVTVPTLFEALSSAAAKRIQVSTSRRSPEGEPSYRIENVSFGFRPFGTGPSTVWVFYYEGPPDLTPLPPVCRFFQLGRYLDNYTVEDVTTAIRTGYQLLGEPAPEMKFHEETDLLIAVGSENQLKLIDAALQELRSDSLVDPNTGQVLPPRPRRSDSLVDPNTGQDLPPRPRGAPKAGSARP